MRRAQTHAASPGPTSHPHTARQRPFVRVAAAAAALALVVLAAKQSATAAAPPAAPTPQTSILPRSIGIGIGTQQPLSLDFTSPMDARSVDSSLLLYPEAAMRLAWSDDARHVHISPATRWQTDTRYVLLVPDSALLANGSVLGAALRYSFTTQTAPAVTQFAVTRAGAGSARVRLSLEESAGGTPAPAPADTADSTSVRTSISIGFSAAMNRREVERGFVISPSVRGTFSWQGTGITFTPSTRLDPNARYAVAVLGAHDLQGNLLGGDVSFSFNTISAAHVVRVSPANGARGVTGRTVRVLFSGAVDAATTGRAFQLADLTSKRAVAGSVTWNVHRTQLSFTTTAGLARGHRFEVRIGKGSLDKDGNSLRATFGFTSRSAPKPAARPAAAAAGSSPRYTAPLPSGNGQAYALSLINASRRAYGFSALRLDAALSAVASAHAADQVRYNYFSHNSLNGATPEDRMRAAGISFAHSGENQCYDYGSITSALAWCHSVMMSEPYPGLWNHIANILNPSFTHVGIGYARAANGKLIVTWDFTN